MKIVPVDQQLNRLVYELHDLTSSEITVLDSVGFSFRAIATGTRWCYDEAKRVAVG